MKGMKGMKRRLFPLLAAGSLVLWLTVAVFFVRSFWVVDTWRRFHWDGVTLTDVAVWSSGGQVGRTWFSMQGTEPRWIAERNADAKDGQFGCWRYSHRQPGPGEQNKWYGATRYSDPPSPMSMASLTIVAIPTWPILLLLAIAPALWLRRFRRLRRRERLGLCLRCGYDLRATPERCPECGTAVADLRRRSVGET